MRNLFRFHRSQPVLVACALMTSALPGSSVARADTCTPWHIDVSAQFSSSTYDDDGNLVHAESAGSGHVSHLGAVSVAGLNSFTPLENGLLRIDGDGVFVAANGDQIFVNFDGSVMDLGTGAGTGTYVVTGGTGRFQGATGTADFASSSLAPSGFTLVGDGTLCF